MPAVVFFGIVAKSEVNFFCEEGMVLLEKTHPYQATQLCHYLAELLTMMKWTTPHLGREESVCAVSYTALGHCRYQRSRERSYKIGSLSM